MSDGREEAAELPVGTVDASGEPMAVAGVTPPEQPPMIDAEDDGEVDELQVQGGE